MKSKTWRWTLGIIYVIAVALIWIAASFVVQSVVDGGVSPFLITYICNSLFVIYIPIVEIGDLLKNAFCIWNHSGKATKQTVRLQLKPLENVTPLQDDVLNCGDTDEQARSKVAQTISDDKLISEDDPLDHEPLINREQLISENAGYGHLTDGDGNNISTKRQWTRMEIAKASLLICPFWFLAQLTFNLSLKYTTVTSNTILSSTSSLFTFLVSLVMLNEKFTWIKLASVLFCMTGTIAVSLGDTESGHNDIATNPLLGDFLCVVSAVFYALYSTLISKRLPDEEKGEAQVSMGHFLGFLGLFNMIIFFPVAVMLHLTKVEPFHRLTLMQFGLVVGKGLLDNVLSDYLWAKAVLLTSPTVATAGLTIQVPLAALIDTLRGNLPDLLDYLGGAAVLVGFFGLNQPMADCCSMDGVDGQLKDDESHQGAVST